MLLKLVERNRKMKEHLVSHAAPSHFTYNDQVYAVLPKAINHVRKYIIKEAQKREKFRNTGMAPGANLYPQPPHSVSKSNVIKVLERKTGPFMEWFAEQTGSEVLDPQRADEL